MPIMPTSPYMLGNSESVRLWCAFCHSDCTLMITGVVGHRFNTNKALNTVESCTPASRSTIWETGLFTMKPVGLANKLVSLVGLRLGISST